MSRKVKSKPKQEKVVIPESTQNEIRYLLKNEYKVFLDKDCKNETLRHEFYQVVDGDKHHFYHLRYSNSLKYLDEVPKVKDFPVIDVNSEEVNTIIDKIIEDIVHNYLEWNGYTLACNKPL